MGFPDLIPGFDLTRLTPLDLVTFCEREKIPFTLFESWETILATTKDILGGKVSVKTVAQDGLEAVHQGANKV